MWANMAGVCVGNASRDRSDITIHDSVIGKQTHRCHFVTIAAAASNALALKVRRASCVRVVCRPEQVFLLCEKYGLIDVGINF